MPLATDIVPFGFNVNPVGTDIGVKVTFPPTPTVAGVLPFTVSFVNTDGVGLPGVAVAASFTASIVGNTVTVAVAVSHTVGLLT